jgi:hypothetical protein
MKGSVTNTKQIIKYYKRREINNLSIRFVDKSLLTIEILIHPNVTTYCHRSKYSLVTPIEIQDEESDARSFPLRFRDGIVFSITPA